jgi:voltage-gated sodium channel
MVLLADKYLRLSRICHSFAYHPGFVNFVTAVICLAGVLVGIQTYPSMEDVEALNIIDLLILAIFTFEVAIKLIAENFHPWTYFNSGWNCFDFVIVVGSFLPGGGSMVTMLRLLRLLRVLKLVKSLPDLQLIVDALVQGLASIGYIGIILMMVFYLFAILGMTLFKDNDPWHFGTLHISMITLFRCSTLEDWTDVMVQYI